MAITAWLTDLDGILGPGQNYYLYLHPKTQKFLFIPWDQDQPFGQFPRGTQEQRENLSIHKPWSGENRFLERVYKSESFKTAYLARLTDFNKTIFEAGADSSASRRIGRCSSRSDSGGIARTPFGVRQGGRWPKADYRDGAWLSGWD